MTRIHVRAAVAASKPAFRPAPPPAHLTPASQALWIEIIRGRAFQPQDYVVLQCALEALDRCEQARLALAEHGLTYTDSKAMVRSRPEVAVERDSRTAYLRALRELHLEPPEGPSGPVPWALKA